MSTVLLPAHVPAFPELEADPAASTVTDSLRAAGVAVSDAGSAIDRSGAPADWTGQTAAAAQHRMTVFAGATRAAVSALEVVTLACDRYVSAVADLRLQRAELEAERVDLNGSIDTLRQSVSSAEEEDAAGLQAQADRLAAGARDLTGRIETWQRHVTAAEDRLIAAFASVDTEAEGEQRTHDPSVPDPAALERALRAIGRDPEAVHDWWTHLSPEEREALKLHSPELVGNTDGIPCDDRDEANRASLRHDLDHLHALQDAGVPLTDDQRRELERAEATQAALDLGLTATDLNTGQPVDTNLLLYLPEAFGGDGAGAVSYGDPDTAENTAVIVPGLTNDLSSIEGQGTDALHLFQEASNHHETTAVIAWMGYDAPSWDPQDLLDYPDDAVDVGGVAREGLAEAGGHRLSDFVDGLRATDEGPRSHLTVIGHSYGSTTAAHAAHDGLDADSLTLIGSPGAGDGVQDVSGLNMPAGHVYVGSADNDYVTWLGRDGSVGMGQDPSQADFGATRFPVAPGPSFHADDLGQGITNHTSYFDQGSTSMTSMGTIVAGDQPDVVEGRHEPANDLAVDWAQHEAAYQAHQAYEHHVAPVVDEIVETGEHVRDGVVGAGHAAYETGHDVLVGGVHVVTDPVGSFQDLWR